MPRTADDKPTIPQAEFDRITGANRDDWRKWERRRLVTAKAPGGYSWAQVVDAIGLVTLETLGGLAAVVQCWDDIGPRLRGTINPEILDLVFDPGTSEQSRPEMRAVVSFDDAATATACRQAGSPGVAGLAQVLAGARREFERVVARTAMHEDRPLGTPSRKRKRSPKVAATHQGAEVNGA